MLIFAAVLLRLNPITMKKLFLILIVATLVFCGCNRSNPFKVTLNLDNAEGQTAYLCKTVENNDVCIDSAVIMDKTAVFTVDPNDPQITYIIKFNKKEKCNVYPFFTENQNTTITGDCNDMPHWNVKGCPTMDVLMAYHEETMKQYEEPIMAYFNKMNELAMNNDTVVSFEMDEQLQTLMEAYHNHQVEFIRSHSDSYLGHYMLDLCKYDFDIEVVKDLSNGFTNESVYSKNVKDYIEKYERGEVERPSCIVVD